MKNKNIIKGKINVPKVIKGLSRKHFKENSRVNMFHKDPKTYNRKQKHNKNHESA